MDHGSVQQDTLIMRNDILLVRASEPPSQSEIIATGRSDNDKTRFGEVIKAGPGKMNKKTGKRMSMSVGVGDKVMFGHMTGEDHFMLVDGENLLVMREIDIMAVVD